MKTLRPFPFPLNVGTDICQISRIYGIVAGPQRTRFINRILAPEERGRKEVQLVNQVSHQNLTNNGNKRDEARYGSNDVNQRDPALWKTAVFIAGR